MNQANLQVRTKSAIISSSLLHEPFSALLPLLPFILLKEMHASSLQITVLAVFKPLMSLLSFFYSTYLSKFNFSLKTSLLMTGFFARAPLLLALFCNNAWVYIFACAMYMLFSRASILPWMEILRLNLAQKVLQKFFSFGSMLSYVLGIGLAFLFGFLIDRPGFWKILFALVLCTGLVAVILQACLPQIKPQMVSNSGVEAKPFKEMVSLLKKRPDFLRFQYFYMAGGFGLMLLSPALPNYFCKDLGLNYQDLLHLFAVCKATGFVIASPFWQKSLSMSTINGFSRSVLSGFLIYVLILYLAKFSIGLIFVAHIIYGVFQAASHLIWHTSGPLFSMGTNSSIYTSINVFTVGLRGCIAPLLGGCIFIVYGFSGVFFASSICFLIGIILTHTFKIHESVVN